MRQGGDSTRAGLAARIRTLDVPRIVAIDGGAASGKTRLAGRLAAELDAAVVHIDDLLDGWGGQFTFWSRLRAGVLEPFRHGLAGSYERYDWNRARFGPAVVVPASRTLLVEGVSAIAACAAAADLRIYLDVPRAERERRWMARDGHPLQPEWITWLDAEDAFFAAHPPAADVLLTGQGRYRPQPHRRADVVVPTDAPRGSR